MGALRIILLIDPSIAAILYLGMARVLGGPVLSMHTNEVRIRVECEALLQVRDTSGLYVIDNGE